LILPEINDRDWFSWEGMERIKDNIRDKLKNDNDYSGDRGELKLYFDVCDGWMQALNERKTYKQRSEEWAAKQRILHPPINNRLNDDEKQYIVDRLFGANDPIGQSVLKKLKI